MFSSSISVLTALTMLAHSVWGCCWHHAHPEPFGHVCTASVVANHAAAHSHRACDQTNGHSDSIHQNNVVDAGQCENDSQPQDEHHHGSCSETRCSFVKTTPVSIDGFCYAQANAALADDVAATPVLATSWFKGDNPVQPRTALSVCAVTQCWLL